MLEQPRAGWLGLAAQTPLPNGAGGTDEGGSNVQQGLGLGWPMQLRTRTTVTCTLPRHEQYPGWSATAEHRRSRACAQCRGCVCYSGCEPHGSAVVWIPIGQHQGHGDRPGPGGYVGHWQAAILCFEKCWQPGTTGTLTSNMDFATKEALEPVSFTTYVFASLSLRAPTSPVAPLGAWTMELLSALRTLPMRLLVPLVASMGWTTRAPCCPAR
jgi:hypothetical protein